MSFIRERQRNTELFSRILILFFLLSPICSQELSQNSILEETQNIFNKDLSWSSVLEETDQQDIVYNNKDKILELVKQYRLKMLENPNNATLYFLYGRLMGFLGQPENALPFFYKAINKDSNCLWGYYGLGMYYLQKKALFQAEIFLEECHKRNPNFAPYWEARAKAEQHHLQQAIESMKRACQILPNRSSYWHNLGDLYLQHGQNKKAEESLLYALKCDKNNISAMKDLILFYLTEHRYEDALVYLKQIQALCPQDKEKWQQWIDKIE